MVFGDNTTAAAFIGASVTLVLIIIFMILVVILVRQCLAFVAKRNDIRRQIEQQRAQRAEMERQRRLSISEPVNPTFDWHHSIRIAGTPPPSYHEAKTLPPLEPECNSTLQNKDKKKNEIDVGDNDSDVSITIDNNPAINQPIEDNDKQVDNRIASMSVPSEVVIVVESETSNNNELETITIEQQSNADNDSTTSL